MLTPETEANIEKVLEWYNEDHSRYPCNGSNAVVLAQELSIIPSEVNIATRRIALGLVSLSKPKTKTKTSK
jgi:hypothetical protein